jgi:IS5 family transposase
VQQIHRATRRKGAAAVAAQQAAYARLCQVARQVARQADRVAQALAVIAAGGERPPVAVAHELARVLPLVRRVIAQTERRVLHGEAVPAESKVVSLVEPHTAIIPRHKAGRPVAFGRKLWLAEAEGGIVTEARLLEGAPPDAPEVLPSVRRHLRQFGRVPDSLTGERGCSTAPVRRELAALGGRRVALPHTGRATAASRAQERERGFQRGYRWRAGSEGRIGMLQRSFGLARCPDHGEGGLARWVGWGVLTANLVTLARAPAVR